MVESVFNEKSSLNLSIFGWCVALSFAPSVLFSFIVSVVLAINGLNIYETDDPQIEVMIALWTSILSPVLFFPLLIYVLGCKDFAEISSYLRVCKIRLDHVFYVMIFTVFLEISFDVFWFLIVFLLMTFYLKLESLSAHMRRL